MRRMGRPSTLTQAIADEICERISDGEPLRAICRDDHMPAWRTVYDWISADTDFSARIARARELGFDAIAEEALSIADTPTIGQTSVSKATGLEVTEADMLGHRRLQVETRLKLLAKWAPKKYGDKQEIDLNVTDALAERLARAKLRNG